MSIRTLARREEVHPGITAWRFDITLPGGEKLEGLEVSQAFDLLSRQSHFSHQWAHTVIRLAQMGAASCN